MPVVTVEAVVMTEAGISLLDEEGRMVVKIEGKARVETAVLLRQKLAESLITQEVAIDWAEAEHVDASVLQVLLALRKLLGERGLPLVVDKDNTKVREYLRLSGLTEYFPLGGEALGKRAERSLQEHAPGGGALG
ncbi:MAG: STAS domain-containing protein [Terriglobales bacterium]